MVVVRSFQDRANTHIFNVLFRHFKHFVELGDQAFVFRFLDQIDHVFGVGKRTRALFIRTNFIANCRNFPSNLGRFFKILPNVGVFLFLFKLRKPRA